jgi:hypothetical protein
MRLKPDDLTAVGKQEIQRKIPVLQTNICRPRSENFMVRLDSDWLALTLFIAFGEVASSPD